MLSVWSVSDAGTWAIWRVCRKRRWWIMWWSCGRRIKRLAMGIDDSPVSSAGEPERYTERFEFLFPVDMVSGMKAGLRSLAERIWRRAGLDGRWVGEAHLSGSLDVGEVWRFGRELCNPASSADRLCHTLSALLGSGNWSAMALMGLTLTAGRLSAEMGWQAGLWRGTPHPAHRIYPVWSGWPR